MSSYAGSIPALYDRHLGPVLFTPYAREIVGRVPERARRVLEVAAGTGRTTRELAARGLTVVATDLQDAMLAEARTHVTGDVTWQTADAQALPFADGAFDVVVCAFGLMFPPDRAAAVRELKRVGKTVVVAVWDSLAANPASELLDEMASALMPHDPPAFMALPFSLGNVDELRALVGGEIETVRHVGVSESAASLAAGFVRGNPLHTQLVERGLDAAAFEARVAAALAERYGDQPCRIPLSAHLIVV